MDDTCILHVVDHESKRGGKLKRRGRPLGPGRSATESPGGERGKERGTGSRALSPPINLHVPFLSHTYTYPFSILTNMSFMGGGAECGPANPLASLSKVAQVDNSLQRVCVPCHCLPSLPFLLV
jgi:hypothetical protein